MFLFKSVRHINLSRLLRPNASLHDLFPCLTINYAVFKNFAKCDTLFSRRRYIEEKTRRERKRERERERERERATTKTSKPQ